MRETPGVVIKSKFKVPGTKKKSRRYTTYLDYINRPDTKDSREQFESYHDYMGDEMKSSGLFTREDDRLDDEKRRAVRDIFKHAQENGSILWQDVISFDNAWLRETGVLHDDLVDEKRLIQATRNAIDSMLQKEKMVHAYWTGAVHYNTDNIHVHVAIVETSHMRERGKRKPKSIELMKSKVICSLADRTKEQEKLNAFIRDELVAHKRNRKIQTLPNRVLHPDLVRQFKDIYEQLPEDKRQWRYNMNGMQPLRESLDRLTDRYIDIHFKSEFQAFNERLEQEVSFHRRSYGDKVKAERYRTTKRQDLYTRMGNAILSEMRELAKEQHVNEKSEARKHPVRRAFKQQKIFNESLYRIERHMNDEFEHLKNQRAFEQLERDIEYGK
ncbi:MULTISPECIES: MobP2 family relaxase [Exiguobacterium]|uniref:MobP2 family relaxase n=1 Tax=Exiguobacterium TaxID=33986 RepID=UPI001BE9731E|nr:MULTISPECIES: MobP2 family relaxase [Exiguobacterium]MCT4783119.1 relaxase MobL [Exiguobacterium himgiriensis]